MNDLFEPLATAADAVLSPCALYRYQLYRRWEAGAYALPIIMLNPSTADGHVDDPTIRRCMAFAKRDGFGGIRVGNLYAYRATDPTLLRLCDDPIGPDNDEHLLQLLTRAKEASVPVLAAWGATLGHWNRSDAVRAIAVRVGVDLRCLGSTAAGHPRHPLYVKGDQPMEPFA